VLDIFGKVIEKEFKNKGVPLKILFLEKLVR
jgi:hypothetical protein